MNIIRRNTRNLRRTRLEKRSIRNNSRNITRTRRFESTYNVDDSELKKWEAEHCIDRLENMEGYEISVDELAAYLTERGIDPEGLSRKEMLKRVKEI